MPEGIIKFNCQWEETEMDLSQEVYSRLEASRSKFYSLGLIGNYPDGIGYGNLSVRCRKGNSFYISGSGTGGKPFLEPSDYALVRAFDVKKNSLNCKGLTKASSESLTHAAVYRALPTVGAVVHVNCLWLWEKLLECYPATSASIEYGTPEMAEAVGTLALKVNEKGIKVLVMAGHQEGILAFDEDITAATELIIHLYNRYKHD